LAVVGQLWLYQATLFCGKYGCHWATVSVKRATFWATSAAFGLFGYIRQLWLSLDISSKSATFHYDHSVTLPPGTTTATTVETMTAF